MTERDVSRLSTRIDEFLTARPTLERFLSAVGLVIENVVKVPLYRCQRCGECALSHTAFVCSQRCPKRLRNGACGGTRPGGFCEVYPERRCIWYLIHQRSRALRRVPFLTVRLDPHQWSLEHSPAWLNVFRGREEGPAFRMGPVADRMDAHTARRAGSETEP
ncbi:MAG: methylenetetrahydrofolate reductase C-terminal domain-containing protein [Candidatus Eisenbacteria bacterium]